MVFKKKQPTSNVVVGKKEKLSTRLQRKAQNSTRKERRLLVIMVGVFFVLSLVLAYVYGEYRGAPQQPSANGCSSGEGYKNAIAAEKYYYQNTDYQTGFAQHVKTIEAIDGYDKDQRCLVVLAVYYGRIGEYKNAQEIINQLEALSKNQGQSYKDEHIRYAKQLAAFYENQEKYLNEQVKTNQFINPVEQ